jgi:hypothetical protein
MDFQTFISSLKTYWLQYTAAAAIFGSVYYSGISHEKVRLAEESGKKELKDLKDSARYYFQSMNYNVSGLITLTQKSYDTMIFTSGMMRITSQTLKTHLSNEKAYKELLDYKDAEIAELKKNNSPETP